ncbi:cation transporter [Amorphus coralli]|uniref:cation transporter n=1 Tax=Amorphus coralli TaxID=340680 RepID=UPI00036B7461|nr:cation transporter [Amorphus coralli]
MSASCCAATPSAPDPKHRRILWVVLAINVAGFLVEIVAGLQAGSASLQADALDFLADAGNYAISLMVFGMALRWRALAALAKGASMGIFGLWVVGSTGWYAWRGEVPSADLMGSIGLMALVLNVICLVLLTGFRRGDANMRSVWVCSRNDVIGNVAVMLAALGVFGTGTGWPDIGVAAVMATLALWGAAQVMGDALRELRIVRAGDAEATGSPSVP